MKVETYTSKPLVIHGVKIPEWLEVLLIILLFVALVIPYIIVFVGDLIATVFIQRT